MELHKTGTEDSLKPPDDHLDPSERFLPGSVDNKWKNKKFLLRVIVVTTVIALAAIVALIVGLLVWNFHLRTEEKIQKVFGGSLTIGNRRFVRTYENTSSAEFNELASQLIKYMKNMYSSVPILSRYYINSNIQAFSESSDGNVVAYYISEFSVPEAEISAVDEAIDTHMHNKPGAGQTRRLSQNLQQTNELLISNIMSAVVDPRLINSTLKGPFTEFHHSRPGKNGSIQFPGPSASSYTARTYKEWHLRADPKHRIKLRFSEIALEHDCNNNFIRVYDSLVPCDNQIMAEKCGHSIYSDQLDFLSSGNVMLVTLVTDGEKDISSFSAMYSQVPTEIQGCDAKLTGSEGTFKSPGFPYSYPPQTQCVWNIKVPEGKYILINFRTFSLKDPRQSPGNCTKDYLEINGSRMCGETNGIIRRVIKTNETELKFFSDMAYVGRGFSATFEAFGAFDRCKEFHCENDACIPLKLKCDGYDDCGDMSDEKNCVCKESHIKCTNGFCKPKYLHCDKVDDCGDNSDEENCENCKAGELTCQNGRCVSEQKKCDGHNDCEDGSDETDCTESTVVPCSKITYKCKNNACISKQNPQCDAQEDCEDGSDEEDCKCGTRPYQSSMIVGGVEATEGYWPWQVSLHLKGKGHACGASLINNIWLVTAAHCIYDTNRYSGPEQWDVYLGLHVQNHANSPNTVKKQVQHIICHPKYNYKSMDNDIALMQLDSPVNLTQNIWPICLPAATHMLPAGQSVWVTGWGKTKEEGYLASALQEAEVRIINQTVCSQLMTDEITPQMICAGILTGGVDSCQGDSGGPMSFVDPATGRFFQVGIVSWGEGCGRKDKPGIYTRMTKYRSWIREKTGV